VYWCMGWGVGESKMMDRKCIIRNVSKQMVAIAHSLPSLLHFHAERPIIDQLQELILA
jgi:hypothetical protein